uniref:Methyltransferase domain-containing protein n=1 Tax=Candidatus Kentrum sp. FW TaxID=2126338 RepID=A0A450TVB5_9GAMM|nr:MAG: Methyltransferase domain-containing protein [Candidatus Kentron sp. FW]
MDIMKGVNAYFKELSKEEIRTKAHREFVGGLWDELGNLQLEFLIKSGLKPSHRLLDIGCGSLRGGVRYIQYLQEGNYYGLDINGSLIEAGRIEVDEAGLSNKNPTLIVDEKFSFDKFGQRFDFMVSVSVFTHLPMNIILRCLNMARESLAPNGIYYSTFFQAPTSLHLEKIKQQPGGIVTNYDSDPFHYSIEELSHMANLAKLKLQVIGDWGHPRNQKMAAFTFSK